MADDDLAPTTPDFARKQLEAFNREGMAKTQAFVDSLGNSPPPFLYHYTDDRGLHGILKNGTLWFTDIFDLNDPSELRHGYSHLGRMLTRRAQLENLDSSPLWPFAAEIEAIGRSGLRETADFFVCSFSSDGDELGQWRAYADNGRGFALAFEGAELERPLAETGRHSSFPISYDEAPLLGMHEWLVDAVVPLVHLPFDPRWPRAEGGFDDEGKAALRAYMRDLSTLTAIQAIQAALFFKHRAYRNENEYRFLETHARRPGQPLTQVVHRTRPYSLARYREYGWRKNSPAALKKIIVGPAAGDRAVEFVHDNLREFHRGEVEVVRSTIPYRVR